ncbi:MAG: fluoride efflux transporter CrcB [Granulosicoccus sp.]
MNTWLSWISVAAGGAGGACARYGLGLLVSGHVTRLPLGTLLVNLIGCFLAGVLTSWYVHRGAVPGPEYLLLMAGFLGGFTTFSAFSVDTLRLVEAGHGALALGNVMLNLVGSLLAVTLGAWVARLM